MQILDVPVLDVVTLPPEGDNDDMATAAELTTKVATLEERVANNIILFRVVVGFGFVWLAAITWLLIQIKGTVDHLAQAQASVPVQVVGRLLGNSAASKAEIAANLNAAATILQTSKVGPSKPDSSALRTVSAKLSEIQQEYPDLLQVWQATGAFISYRSSARKTPIDTKQCTNTVQKEGMVIANCEVALEDLARHVSGNTLNGLPLPFTFVNCIVHYRGGSIPAKRLTFINCVFRFDVTSQPPREGVLAMRQLTTADNDADISIALA